MPEVTERLKELLAKASTEEDSEKLMRLMLEINRLLEEHQGRSRRDRRLQKRT